MGNFARSATCSAARTTLEPISWPRRASILSDGINRRRLIMWQICRVNAETPCVGSNSAASLLSPQMPRHASAVGTVAI